MTGKIGLTRLAGKISDGHPLQDFLHAQRQPPARYLRLRVAFKKLEEA
jgi:hypothetical protein